MIVAAPPNALRRGEKLAVGLFSYAGEETVTLESQVSPYRFDTNKTNALERNEDSFDLASGGTKAGPLVRAARRGL